MLFRAFSLTPSPATQANRTPIAGKPHSQPPGALIDAHDILRELVELEQQYSESIDSSQAGSLLPKLKPLFSAARACLARAKLGPISAQRGQSTIENRLEKLEGAISRLSSSLTNSGPASWAQVARRPFAQLPRAPAQPTAEAPQETARQSKQLLVRITDPGDAEVLKDVSAQNLIQRIQGAGGASQKHASRGIIAVKKLGNDRLLIHTDSVQGRNALQKHTDWTKSLCPSASVHQRSFAVLIHGVHTALYKRETCGEFERKLEKENSKLHPNMKISRSAWVKRLNKDQATSSLIIEVSSAAVANRMISEGVTLGYELKTVELYDYKGRITQCFRCQKYGSHTSTTCRALQRCGNCGGAYLTKECLTEAQDMRRQCAACKGGNHQSWSPECPERKKEAARARIAYESRAALYPVPIMPVLYSVETEPTPARYAFNSQEPRRSSADDSNQE